MSDLNITTTIAQLPNLQGLAGAQLAHPEAQQVFAAQLAQESLKEQMHQVQKVEKQEGSEAVKDEKEGRGREQQMHQHNRQSKKETPEDVDSAPASASPWLGHLINKKV